MAGGLVNFLREADSPLFTAEAQSFAEATQREIERLRSSLCASSAVLCVSAVNGFDEIAPRKNMTDTRMAGRFTHLKFAGNAVFCLGLKSSPTKNRNEKHSNKFHSLASILLPVK